MEEWRKDARSEVLIVDLEALVPQDHLLRKIERVMDYEWIYERLDPYYCHNNGRPGTDPVVLIKMVLIQHLYGIPSLRQTHQRIQDTLSYRWFLGYNLLEGIPHFATVSYAFCKRFPEELTTEIFEHILNKALNNRMVDPSVIFIDGTHIKASANKKKFQKRQVEKVAKIYADQLREEVNAEREKLGKKPIEDKLRRVEHNMPKTCSCGDFSRFHRRKASAFLPPQAQKFIRNSCVFGASQFKIVIFLMKQGTKSTAYCRMPRFLTQFQRK